MPDFSLRARRLRAAGFNARHVASIGRRLMLRAATGSNATAASKTIGTTNSAVTYTAPLWRGAGGNNWRVAHIVAGVSTPLSVVVSGRDVTVNVATNGSSAATSTSAQVAAAVNAVTALTDTGFTATAGGTGAGVVVAGAIGNLTGGAGGA
jgi:hypothetical protein